METTIGFIGLGIIGRPMAERLLEAGLPLIVWNRTRAKAEELSARGAGVASSPKQLAARSDIVVTMLTDGGAVKEVAQRDDGLAAGFSAGKAHCDMSTIDLESTRLLEQFYRARGIDFVRAPVLGNKRAAASGTLLIFAGGAAAAIEKCQPLFQALGSRTWRWERPEQATCVKLACNLLLGGMMAIFAESLVFAAKAGVDLRAMLEIYAASALAAPMYQSKGKSIVEGNFAPNFYLRNMRKDFDLALSTAEELNAALPATERVRDVFASAEEQGLAQEDYSAVIRWLEQQPAVRPRPIEARR